MKKILYHGSDYDFNKFAFINAGKKSGLSGAGYGLYFTTSKADALCYGKILYTVEATVKKAISLYKVTFSRTLLIKLLQEFERISENSYVEAFGDISDGINSVAYRNAFTEAINSLLKYNKSDVDIVNDIMHATSGEDAMLKVLKKFGYSHTIDTTTPNGKDPDGKRTQNWIFYDTDCLKIIKKEKELLESVDFETPQYLTAPQHNILKGTDIYRGLVNQKFNAILEHESIDDWRELEEAAGRAHSKAQRRLMAMAMAYKRGDLSKKYVNQTIKKLAKTIDEDTLEDFASTKQKRRRKDGSIGKRNAIPHYVDY